MNEGTLLPTFQKLKKFIKEYCEQLYSNKLYNLDKMDKFLERHKLLKLTQEEIDYLSKCNK